MNILEVYEHTGGVSYWRCMNILEVYEHTGGV